MIILQFCILVVPYTLQSAAAAATAAEKRAACDGASSASASGGDAGTPRERKAPRATGRLSAPAPEEHMQGLRGETPSVTLAPSAFTAAFAGDNRIVPFSSLLFPDPDGPPPMVSAHSMYLPPPFSPFPVLLCPDREDTYYLRSLASTLCACPLATPCSCEMECLNPKP